MLGIANSVNFQPAGGLSLLTDTAVSRFDMRTGHHVLMHQQEEGWASYGIPYVTLARIRATYALDLSEAGEDRHGPYWLWTKIPENKVVTEMKPRSLRR